MIFHWRFANKDLYGAYIATVRDLMNSSTAKLIVDVGGGNQCPFARYRSPGTKIVAVDLSEEAMASNHDVDERRVADVVHEGLPFGDDEVDLVTSRAVLEHLTDVEVFTRETARVLRSGGHAVHVFPGRNSSFAVANRMLGNRRSRALLHALLPQFEGICGFPAYYDHCSPRAIRKAIERSGLKVELIDVSYFGSHYYKFFLPVFLISAAYEKMISAIGNEELSAYVLAIALKT
ncbi:MAG: class I SAM-dependent methyltransferase [Actinomycetota bacterium]|nr:class I SAM-dependent methyltransferase [Actinomycetota bacterium]